MGLLWLFIFLCCLVLALLIAGWFERRRR